MCGICGLLAPSGRADPALVERDERARSSTAGPTRARRRRVRPLRPRPPAPAGDRPRARAASRSTNETGDVDRRLQRRALQLPRAARRARAGHEVRGTGDTPVIPHLYEEHGVGFVERLDGMFALALWDAGARAARARARPRRQEAARSGRACRDGTLAFASELKALLAAARRLARARPAALDAYLALQYVPGARTALRGIEKLPPGHVLVAEGGEVTRRARTGSREPARSRRGRVARARARRRSARRCASGSSPTCRSARSSPAGSTRASSSRRWRRRRRRRCGRSPSASRDDRYDERAYARAVAERYATRARGDRARAGRCGDLLPRLAAAFDEPLGDEAALPHLRRSARPRAGT